MCKRVKYYNGVKLPRGTVYCGRPGRWGNPFSIGPHTREQVIDMHKQWIDGALILVRKPPPTKEEIRKYLRGKDLACWCQLHEACHTDYLLEIANS